MVDQQSFASLAWARKGKVTRRERFLAEMDAVIPWQQLVDLIEPHYPKGETGRPPQGLERMLRIYFLQQWFNLSDPQAEDAIYDSESMLATRGPSSASDDGQLTAIGCSGGRRTLRKGAKILASGRYSAFRARADRCENHESSSDSVNRGSNPRRGSILRSLAASPAPYRNQQSCSLVASSAPARLHIRSCAPDVLCSPRVPIASLRIGSAAAAIRSSAVAWK